MLETVKVKMKNTCRYDFCPKTKFVLKAIQLSEQMLTEQRLLEQRLLEQRLLEQKLLEQM